MDLLLGYFSQSARVPLHPIQPSCYYLLGVIQVVPDGNIGELVNLVKPLFALAEKHLMVVMPPLPRYLFFGSCLDKSHSTNIGAEVYTAKLLEATFHFRKVLKTNLVGSTELGRFWVVDTLSCIGTTPPPPPNNVGKARGFAPVIRIGWGPPHGFREIPSFQKLGKNGFGVQGRFVR